MWLILMVVAGIIFGKIFTIHIPSNLTLIILSFLIFFAGFGVGSEEQLFNKVKRNVLAILILVLLTVSGTFFGAFLASFFMPIDYKESILASAGFGWYSLSSVMISSMYSPYLGSISFLANVFRESLAILFIPLVSKFYSYGAVSIGGSPSMDTLLGVVAKYNDKEITLVSFGHGVVLSTITPLIISALFYIFFR